ncbi:hypothetical protein BH23ACT6_BH23ACT6_25090 [soil metagenome]
MPAEFAGDLACLERTEAMSYAVSTLSAAPQLRLALVSGKGTDGVRRRSLRCLVGRHTDVSMRLNPEDSSIVSAQCIRCHRVDDGAGVFPHDHTKGDMAWLSQGQGW